MTSKRYFENVRNILMFLSLWLKEKPPQKDTEDLNMSNSMPCYFSKEHATYVSSLTWCLDGNAQCVEADDHVVAD